MPAQKINDKLYNWASEIDEVTLRQAEATARLPIIDGHVALMPDAHLGKGATVGSVIPTHEAVIPSAIGVDIGCGMIATETSLNLSDLPDDLEPFLNALADSVPAGLGKWYNAPEASQASLDWLRAPKRGSALTNKQIEKAAKQLGTLGSGNHFMELCSDERDKVWLIMHSGSRGIGNELAVEHIKIAKAVAQLEGIKLEDPELAYFQEGTPEFDAYIGDMLWAQKYALLNRSEMMQQAVKALRKFAHFKVVQEINCHHNFTQKEVHDGREVWVTRKGAIKSDVGDLGLIPGSMGSPSFIVRGLGNPLSYLSSAHGAGRKMSRNQARKTFTVEQLEEMMAGKVWLKGHGKSLLDEIPTSYKDILQVMEDQSDLVEIVHELRQLVNYKGV